MPAKKKENSKFKIQNSKQSIVTIHGIVKGERVPSRILEEQIQQAAKEVQRLHIFADGQRHRRQNLAGDETVKIIVEGPAGQRLGSMGMTGTEIIVKERLR
jgi:glutamate synthase domain-containing protein 3